MAKFLIISFIFIINLYAIDISAYSQEILNKNKEYVLLSYDVYSLENEKNPVGKVIKHKDTSWKILDYTDKKTGFTAMTVQNEETGKVVVSYGGTTAGKGDHKDILEDVSIISNKSDGKQFIDAIDYVKDVQKKYPNAEIELTGHSLGGGLAGYAGVETGLKTVGINSAPLTLSDEALQSLNERGFERLLNKSNQDNITNLRTNEDLVSASSKAVTKLAKIKEFFGADNVIYDTRPGKDVTVFTWTGLDASSSYVASLKPTDSFLTLKPIFTGFKFIGGGHTLAPLIQKAYPTESINTIIVDENTPIKGSILKTTTPKKISSKNTNTKIKASKIISNTNIGKNSIIKNSNISIKLKGEKVFIKNSTIKSNSIINKNSKINNTNTGIEIGK